MLCGGVYYHPFEKIKELRNIELKYGFNINSVRYASDKEIEKFDNDLKEIGKKWDRETLQVEDLDISEIVVNLKTACKYLNKKVPNFSSLFFSLSVEDYNKYYAQITLQLIREAWNKHDNIDKNEQLYFIYLENDEIKVDRHISHDIRTMSHLCAFENKKRAIQFVTQFSELFKTAMGL